MSVDAVGQLGKTDFLNLLATQLRYQDPTNPVDNTAFIAQLAQFSALEAATNTQTSVEAMGKQEKQLYSLSLLGKNVTGVDSTTSQAFSGTVTGVDVSGETIQVYINGKAVNLEDIQSVA